VKAYRKSEKIDPNNVRSLCCISAKFEELSQKTDLMRMLCDVKQV